MRFKRICFCNLFRMSLLRFQNYFLSRKDHGQRMSYPPPYTGRMNRSGRQSDDGNDEGEGRGDAAGGRGMMTGANDGGRAVTGSRRSGVFLSARPGESRNYLATKRLKRLNFSEEKLQGGRLKAAGKWRNGLPVRGFKRKTLRLTLCSRT